MNHKSGFDYEAQFDLAREGKVSVYVEAHDNQGKVKTAPIRAPAMTIDL
jgi:hypothetical protein